MKNIDKALDEAWSEAVKVAAGHACEYCGKEKNLNSHHVYSRSKASTRWDIENGVCLCVTHHVFGSTFSAHKTPTEFTDWVKEKRGEEWYEALKRRANTMKKFMRTDKMELLDELKALARQ